FGGCHPTDGCQFHSSYPGVKFPLLGANITFDNGLPAALPFTVTVSGGVPIGVIGATLKDLPLVVTPEAIKGLKFGDEVKAINQRTVIQGASFGRLLSVVDLKVDKRTRDVVRSATTAHNEIVTRDVTPDPAAKALVDEATTKAAPIANKPVGSITTDLVRAQ